MDTSSPQQNPSQKQRRVARRRAIRIFFYGSMLAAGTSLAYRIGQHMTAIQSWFQGSVEGVTDTTQVAQIQTTNPLRTETALPTITMQSSPLPTQLLESATDRSPTPMNPHDEIIIARQTEAPERAAAPSPQPTPDLLSQHASSKTLIQPTIISKKEWGSLKAAGTFIPQYPTRITLHHEGVLFTGSQSAASYLRSVQRWCINNRGWPDLPYHYLIDLEGNIYEGRPLETRGDTNTSYDLQDHALIAVLGKYDVGEQVPNQFQIDTVIMLMAWIAHSYAISADRIKGHRDFIPINAKGEHIDPHTHEKITCPGDNLYIYLTNQTIQDGVRKLLTTV